jgi:hypothetical protein
MAYFTFSSAGLKVHPSSNHLRRELPTAPRGIGPILSLVCERMGNRLNPVSLNEHNGDRTIEINHGPRYSVAFSTCIQPVAAG